MLFKQIFTSREIAKIEQKPKQRGAYFMSVLRQNTRRSLLGVSLSLTGTPCFAANADGYAFTGALFKILTELQGAPIALITAIGIVAAGFFWVFKGHDVGMKQVVSALMGGGLVIAAPTLIMMIPGMNGAMI